ncbi:MAG: DinB family protein, partial [Acidimicrobiia bacterium]
MRAKSAIALAEARARTNSILDSLTDADLVEQHSLLMSPLVWDLAHIAHYEELWLLRTLLGAEATDPRFDDVYDAFKHPRAERPTLDLLDVASARAFAAAVRERVLESSPALEPDHHVGALLADDFVYGMVARHEHQHVETMLATLQLMAEG